MKKRNKIILSSISLLSVGLIASTTFAISCSYAISRNVNSNTNDKNNNNNNSSSTTKPVSLNSKIANDLTIYFNNADNKVSLLNYLIKSSLISNSNGKLSYDTNKYSSLDDLLAYGVGKFIQNNPNISYNGVIGSDINISNLQITDSVYDEQSGLVFVVKYKDIQALSDISINNSTLMSINDPYFNIANVLTSYLNVSNNYQTFVNSLFANNILILTNNDLTYNSKFSSFDTALTVGISTFITNHSYTYYDGILWSNINLKRYCYY